MSCGISIGGRSVEGGDVDLSDIQATRLVSGSRDIDADEDAIEINKIISETDTEVSIADETTNEPIITEDSGEEALGIATPLISVSTPCLAVTVFAKPSNNSVIWVGGEDIEENIGGQVYARGAGFRIEIDDVMKVYVLGIFGEGVTYLYETNTEEEEDVEGAIAEMDGEAILEMNGENIQEMS